MINKKPTKQMMMVLMTLLLCCGPNKALALPQQGKKKAAQTNSTKQGKKKAPDKSTQTSPPKKNSQTDSPNDRARAASLVATACEWSENHQAHMQYRAKLHSLQAQGYDRNYATAEMFKQDYFKYLQSLHNMAAAKLGALPSADFSLVKKHFPSALVTVSDSGYRSNAPTCLPCIEETWQPDCPWLKVSESNQQREPSAPQLHDSAQASRGIREQPAISRSQNIAVAQSKFDEAEALVQKDTKETREKAIEKYLEALPHWQAAGDRNMEAITYNRLGHSYFVLGKLQQALKFHTDALKPWRLLRDLGGEGGTLSLIGRVHSAMGDNKNALDSYDKALPLLRTAGDLQMTAFTLNRKGLLLSSTEMQTQAIDIYNQALPLWRTLGLKGDEATTLNNIGKAYDSLGNKSEALNYYKQALPLLSAPSFLGVKATTLNNIGTVHHSLGELAQALTAYNQSLALQRELAVRHGKDTLGNGIANTLNNIAYAHSLQGEQQTALDHYNQALQELQPVLTPNDQRLQALILNNIGLVYAALGEELKALNFYDQSLPLRKLVGDRRGEATTLNNIGLIRTSLGEPLKALDAYNQALQIRKDIADPWGEATTLSNLGGIYFSLRKLPEALDQFQLALPLLRAAGDKKGEARTLSNIAGVYRELGELQKALDHFNQALPLRRATGDRSGEAITLSNLAAAEGKLNRLKDARAHLEAALGIIESLRTEVVSPELRASYFETMQDSFEHYIDLLMQQHKQSATEKHDSTAFQANERARARSLLESLTEARANIRRGVDPALLTREQSVRQRLNAKAETRFKLPSNAAAQIAALNREIDSLTIELQQIQTQIRQASPRYAALTQPQPLSAAEIQQQVLDADTLLLEYSLGAERSFLWAVTPTSLTSHELPKREVIEAAARQVYDLLVARNQQPKEAETREQRQARVAEADRAYPAAAARLGQMLLAPVAQQLGKKRLVIVADGALHYLPFGALPDPNQKAGAWQPLIVEHEVVNLPSASTLAVLRRELKDRKPAARTVAVVADPVFTRDDERFKATTAPAARVTVAAKTEPSLRELANAQVIRKLVPQASGDMNIKRLRYAQSEADGILELVPAREGMRVLGFDANRALVESDRLSQYRYVHFATHGLADGKRAELSTILLSLFDAQGRPQDGFLRAHEVFNLNLPAELVVLSACETGLGKQVKGEGLVSLTRGFMYAGAARVVVSLWAVNDKATAELMTSFYRKMLVEGGRPAAALRAAQIEMWRTKQREAPYYWAAFTLQGEWR